MFTHMHTRTHTHFLKKEKQKTKTLQNMLSDLNPNQHAEALLKKKVYKTVNHRAAGKIQTLVCSTIKTKYSDIKNVELN